MLVLTMEFSKGTVPGTDLRPVGAVGALRPDIPDSPTEDEPTGVS
jgi:hypothetical protein